MHTTSYINSKEINKLDSVRILHTSEQVIKSYTLENKSGPNFDTSLSSKSPDDENQRLT